MPKFWSMQWEKEISQTSYLVLSSPKQWVDHFSSSYFDQTNMALVALVSLILCMPFSTFKTPWIFFPSVFHGTVLSWDLSLLFQEICLISFSLSKMFYKFTFLGCFSWSTNITTIVWTWQYWTSPVFKTSWAVNLSVILNGFLKSSTT